MRFSRVLGFLAVLACDAPPAPREGRPASPQPPSPVATSPGSDVALPYQAPAAVINAGRGALEFGAQVIEAASVLSNASSVRTYGTLTGNGAGGVAYEPMPTDRLVVEPASGERLEIVVVEIAGNGGEATSFIQGDHVLRLRVQGAEIDADVWSSRRGSTREAGAEGQLLLEDRQLEVDLFLRGTETFDSDRSGSRLFDEHDLTGSITQGSARIEVREHWRYEVVSARRGATDSRMETASSVVRTIRSMAEIEAQLYEWRDVEIKKAFRNGKPNELDTFWEGTGEVLADGVVVGRVEMFAEAYEESGGFVGFRVKRAGDVIELERFSAY